MDNSNKYSPAYVSDDVIDTECLSEYMLEAYRCMLFPNGLPLYDGEFVGLSECITSSKTSMKCTCGCASVGIDKHSDWCDAYAKEQT